MLGEPIERYFKKQIASFGHTLSLLKTQLESTPHSNSLEDEHIGAVLSKPGPLACKLKEYLKSLIQMSSEISALEGKLSAITQTKQKPSYDQEVRDKEKVNLHNCVYSQSNKA